MFLVASLCEHLVTARRLTVKRPVASFIPSLTSSCGLFCKLPQCFKLSLLSKTSLVTRSRSRPGMYRIYLDHFALLFSSPLRSFPCGWRRIWQERLVCPRLRIAFPTIAKLHRNLALKPSWRHCIQLERLSDRFIDFLFLSCRAGPYPSLFGTASRVALATSVLSARGYRNNLCLEVRSVSRPPDNSSRI